MTTLALPPKVESAVKPKPTKSEIISAMTVIRMRQIEIETKSRLALREKLQRELEKEVARLVRVKNGPQRVSLGYVSSVDKALENIYVTYDISALPESTERKLREYHEVKECRRNITEKDVRREIAAKLDGFATREERVDALLDDPESRSGLEKMLKHIGL